MRVITFTSLCLTLAVSVANAQIQPQTMQPNETMSEPGENWIMSVTRDAGYIYDASSGEMQGLISIAGQTPAVQPHPARGEFYAAGAYFSRGSYGDRTDVLIIHDYETLSPIAEVDIPNKTTALPFRSYIGLLSDGNHVAVSNMTPAQSISIVDVANRNFVGEISTPGCALILPVANNDFMTICGDGTLMLVEVDGSGNESNRTRSAKFFDVQDDAVYDRPVQTADGWLLVSHAGKAYDVSATGSTMNIGDAWEIVTEDDAEEGWWPGGGQLYTVHKDLGLVYIAMHKGEEYSHHEPGTEVWVFSTAAQRRIARIEFETSVDGVMVTQEAEPLLMISDSEGETHVYDALTFVYERTIEGPGAQLFEDL
jgi:methylamine dehydrogenase heavy chain